MKTHRIKYYLTIVCLTASMLTSTAQNDNTFSIMSLNVDGLPAKFLFFDVNTDGPLSEGSERISAYLAGKKCDIISLQECFNYRWEIWSRLWADYEHDEWTGGIGTEFKELDWLHLQNERYPCDGLNSVWKSDIRSTAYERVAHRQSFGKLSHEFDEFITKGFRRHEFTLKNGAQIVVYNTHFDASSERDEIAGNDKYDRMARISQWKQLRDHILSQLDHRPVIITGDFNSYYHRDSVKAVFIDPIQESGKAVTGDAWIQLCNNGVFPESEIAESNESVDKILYVNPTGGASVEPLTFTTDSTGYRHEDKLLGDHYPLIATFKFNDSASTDISPKRNNKRQRQIYNLKGIRITEGETNHSKGIYIIDNEKGIR